MRSVMEVTAVMSLFAPELALESSVSWAVRASVEKRKRRAQELKRGEDEEEEEGDADAAVATVGGMLKFSPLEEECVAIVIIISKFLLEYI